MEGWRMRSISHPSSFILLPSLLHLGDRLRVDAVVAEVLGRGVAPAAKVVDLEQIRDRRVLRSGRLGYLLVDRAQAVLREDLLRLLGEQEGHERLDGLAIAVLVDVLIDEGDRVFD